MKITRERPKSGDYLKLLKDTEAHTTIDRACAYRVWEGWWRILDTTGEEYLVQRWPDEDNELRKAWSQVPL